MSWVDGRVGVGSAKDMGRAGGLTSNDEKCREISKWPVIFIDALSVRGIRSAIDNAEHRTARQ